MITSQSKHKHNANIMKITTKEFYLLILDKEETMDTEMQKLVTAVGTCLSLGVEATFRFNKLQFGSFCQLIELSPKYKKGHACIEIGSIEIKYFSIVELTKELGEDNPF